MSARLQTQRGSSAKQSFAPMNALALQRKCACGGSAGMSGDCEECGTKRLTLQRRASNPTEPSTVPRIVHEVLRSSGQPLDAETRAFMEPRFGHDFSRVRVHTGGMAAESARAVNAVAYTVGHDVIFAAGHYRPATTEGQGLLAHELTHVVQQHNNIARKERLTMGQEDDPAEREADASAVAILKHRPALFSAQHTNSLVQRQLPTAGTFHVTPTCIPGFSRTLDLQPVFLRTSAADKAPTGVSWARRLSSANAIWGKIGVSFNALSAITLDTPLKTSAVPSSVRALRAGAGVEVFLVANNLSNEGGGQTAYIGASGCGASGSIVMSDFGTSNTLLAHELGHILGLSHPSESSNPGDANTIMKESSSNASDNPTRNTIGNYYRLRCPAAGAATCLLPDT